MKILPILYDNRQNKIQNKKNSDFSIPWRGKIPSFYNLNKDQVAFTGFTFEKTILKTVKRKFMGLGLFKNAEGFTYDFSKIGAEHLTKEKFDITKAKNNEIYAYWHALACQEAYPEVSSGVGTSWVRKFNKKNVPKPNAVFNTLNNPDVAYEKFAENLKELQNPFKNKSLDTPNTLTGVGLDTETTGVGEFDRIIQLAIVPFKNGKIDKKGIFNKLINPEMPIPKEASDVNGITDDMVKDAPTITGLLEEVLTNHLNKNNGLPVMYNYKFDLGKINNAIREYPFNHDIVNANDNIKIIAEKKAHKVLDPFILIQRIHPYLGAKKKLGHQYNWLFCKQMDNAHDALADVKGTIDVLKYCVYYLEKHRKDKTIPLTRREVLIFQNGGKVENIDIPLDVEDCNKLVNFDKSYLMKPMSVVNYFKSYKLTKKSLEKLAPEIGESNVQKIMKERIINEEIGLNTKKHPINPAEMEQIEGKGKFKDMAYVLKTNFKKVLGFAELEPYKGKSKEELEDLITEKSKFYFNGLIEDMHIKNTNPLDIPDGNDLPDIEIAKRVMRESQED